MPDISEVKRVASIVSSQLQGGGGNFTDIARKIIREEIPRDQREGFLTAVARELSGRKHLQDARLLPDVRQPQKEAVSAPEEYQLGFGFGEGPHGKKNRPPTRRHL